MGTNYKNFSNKRGQEQEELEAEAMGIIKPSTKAERTVMSLSIEKADKERLQLYALKQGKTAAAVIRDLIRTYCTV